VRACRLFGRGPRVAFALYVAVTIPVLAAWLIWLVVRLPELVARGRISAGYQLDALTEGWQRVEPLTAISAGLQLLMLLLLPVAITYSIVRLARALASRRRRRPSARSPAPAPPAPAVSFAEAIADHLALKRRHAEEDKAVQRAAGSASAG
jgi:hypothetical protein